MLGSKLCPSRQNRSLHPGTEQCVYLERLSRSKALISLFSLLASLDGSCGGNWLLVTVDSGVKVLAGVALSVGFDLAGSFEGSDQSSGDGADDLVLVVQSADADQLHGWDSLLDDVVGLLIDEGVVLQFVFGLSLRPFLLTTLSASLSGLSDSILALLASGSWLFALCKSISVPFFL